MLICSGIRSSSIGVWGRLVNCVLSLCAPWEFDFFVPSRFKHIPAKPWMLYVLIPCSRKPMNLLTRAVTLTPNFFIFFSSLHNSAELKVSKQRRAHAPLCGSHPFARSVHIHECVCTGIYECEDGPFLPLKMTHKTSVLATYPVKAALGMPFSALKDLWLSPLHTGDQPHLGKKKKKVPSTSRGSCPGGYQAPCPRASLLHLLV